MMKNYENYINLISNLSSGAFILVDDVINYINKAAYTLLGEHLIDSIGKELEKVIMYKSSELKANFIFTLPKEDGHVNVLYVQSKSTIISDGHNIELIIFNKVDSNIYRSSLNSIGDAVILTDLDGKIRFCNKFSEELFTFRLRDIYGSDINDEIEIISNLSEEIHNIRIDEIIYSDNPIGLKSNSYILDFNNNKVYLSMTATKLINNNELVGAVFLFRDVSNFKDSKEKLNKYSMAIKENPNVVIITNSIFRIEYANSKFEDFIDLPLYNTLNTSLTQYFPEFFNNDALDKLMKLDQKNKKITTEIQRFEESYIRWLLISVSAIFNDNNEIANYIFVAQDISKLKKKDELIAHERKNLESIFRATPLGMIIVGEDKKIKKVNKESAKIFNCEARFMVDKKIGQSIDCINVNKMNDFCSETKECNYCFLDKIVDDVVNNQKSVLHEEHMYKYIENANMKTKWIRVSAVPVNIDEKINGVVVIEDITKNKELRKEVISNEKKLRIITDNMMDMITQINSRAEIIYVSPSHLNILGYKPEELVGERFLDYIADEDLDKSKRLFSERIKNKKNFTVELRLIKKDGSHIWVESSGNVVIDEETDELSVVYVSRDITSKKQAELEILKSKEIAESANQSKSQFLANMSHEIRTPMNGIIGMTNITLMTDLNSNQRENLIMVKNSAVSLLNLINSILDFSKIEAGRIHIDEIKMDLRYLCEKIVESFRVLAKDKGLGLIFNCDSKISNYHIGDPNRIRQVVNNIIGNAIKFTEKGYVEFNLKLIKKENEIENVRFSIEDTGIGVKEDYKENIFNMFSQGDGTITRKYGGTGLGLSISKQLVGLMGGDLQFDSKEGEGSTFYFDLPLRTNIGLLSNSSPEDMYSIPETERVKNVLVVEDDRVNQAVTEKLLKKQHHNVKIAANGCEAIELVKNEDFDLILMDIQMPELDGISATRIIREELGKKDIIIIALTAHALTGDKERFLSMGMDDYISKPIDVKEFFSVLDRNMKRVLVKAENRSIDKVLSKINKPNKKDKSAYNEHDVFEFERHMEVINKSIGLGDYNLIERHSHLIKNKSSELGLINIKRHALRLEVKSRNEDIDVCKGIFNLLKKEIDYL